MASFSFRFFVLILILTGTAAKAADVEAPPADKEPVLRVDAGGPTAFVTSLAFAPDGKTLYAGGWDKVVRTWTLDKEGLFKPSVTYRLPVAPGLGGAVNTIALSSDGVWLAAAGQGATRNLAGFRERGFVVPASGALTPLMLRDLGTIYLFNTRDRTVRVLRGHRGSVTALTFGPAREKATPLLLSVAAEEKEGEAEQPRLTARLWDMDKDEARSVEMLPAKPLKNNRPGLALWRSGDDEVRAAFALHDGKLRIWDPVEKETRAVDDLGLNLTVAYLGRNRLLTAGFHNKQEPAQLSLWRVPVDGKPERMQAEPTGAGYARALALLSSKGDGAADLAAVVIWKVGNKETPHEYRLRIVDLRVGKFAALVAELPLWKDRAARQPVLTASLHGDYLAVAGNREHEVRVYPLRRVLKGDKVSPQILRSEGVTFRHASFVRRGKELGLLLNGAVRKERGETAPEPAAAKDDRIFDFGKRQLSEDLAGWKAATPEIGVWRASFDGKQNIVVRDGDKRVGEVVIRAGEQLSDYALLPPGKSIKVPLLAVASHLNGQPRLAVYNAQSGEQLRQFTGHTERLRALAFAPDGRLLVSTADDGRVCVWSLTDLSKVLGRRGQLPGVGVSQAKGGVRVRNVEKDSPVHDKLKAGDILAGLVEKGKLQRIDSPSAFYAAVYRRRPGEKIVLRRGDPEGDDDVALVVGQGIDERKPLFSLFVTRADKVADQEWIGWSPLGPYESSRVKADKYLVWHFNTGDPKGPTRAAGADKYRKIYYQEGLLGELIDKGELSRVEAPRLPPPLLTLWVAEKERVLSREGLAPIVVRSPRVALRMTLRGRPFSSLSALTYRFDNDAETPLRPDRPEGTSFAVPLTLTRGRHRLLVTARTPDVPPQETREILSVDYRPSSPRVRYAKRGQQLFVRAADFKVEADVFAGVVGEDVRVRLRHLHNGAEAASATRTLAAAKAGPDGAIRFEETLKLRLGNNRIEVRAYNAGAGRDDNEAETETLNLDVYYTPKANPPLISFRAVTPLSGQAGEQPLAVDPSRPIVVRAPTILLAGTIKASEELAEAVRDQGRAAEATRLADFEPGKHAEFAFREKITLQPGPQVLRFRARTATSAEAERSLTLEYQPPVPLVRLTTPRAGAILDGQDDSIAVVVQGRLLLPPEPRSYKTVLLVNGKPAPEVPVLDEKAATLAVTVRLRPGESRLQVKTSNRWGTIAYSDELPVRYLRPPIIRGHKHTPVAHKPLLDLQAEVFSPTPLLAETVRVTVNGQLVAANAVDIKSRENNLHQVAFKGVPLDAGSRKQRLVLTCANSDAECRVPADFLVESAEVLSPPVAEFLDPRGDAPRSTPRVEVRFQVRSATALERVRLLQQGRPAQTVDLKPTLRTAGGGFELTAIKEIELEPGVNRLSVEAVSLSGRLPDSPHLLLTYVPPPLRVAIDRLTEIGPKGATLRPQHYEHGIPMFAKSASGHTRLHGRILWADSAGRLEHFVLHLFVNGFQQLPVYVRRASGDKETPFEATLLLNRTEDNRIRLVIPRQDAGSSAECRVDCAKPITRQRLYILALSASSRPDRLKKQILEAVGSRQVEGGMQAHAFADVSVFAPRTEAKLSTDFILSQLVQIRDEICDKQMTPLAADETPMNDVLMVCYEGGEAINDKGNFFETQSTSGSANRFGMSCDDLVEYLADIPGAHVLLLDVNRTKKADDRPRDKIVRWKDDYPDAQSHVVVMRCARRDEAAARPGEIRLIPVLRQTMPRAGRLLGLVRLIDKTIAESRERDPLIFTYYLPTDLAELRVGPPGINAE